MPAFLQQSMSTPAEQFAGQIPSETEQIAAVQVCKSVSGLPPVQPVGKNEVIVLVCVLFAQVDHVEYVNAIQVADVSAQACSSLSTAPGGAQAGFVFPFVLVLVFIPSTQALHCPYRQTGEQSTGAEDDLLHAPSVHPYRHVMSDFSPI